MYDWSDVRLTVAGLFVGTITGMTGIGGSSVLAPILILLFGMKAQIAIGTDLLYSVPMKALAAYTHVKQRTVDPRIVALLSAGGIPGAIAGLASFAYLRMRVGEASLEPVLRHAIGVTILAAAVMTLIMTIAARRTTVPSARPPRAAPVAIGAAVGFVVALTSIGSGSITLPLLLLALPALSLRSLIGSEIVFAALMVPVAAAGHVAFADVDWHAARSLVIGAVPGAYAGAKLCARLGEGTLRPAVIGILTFAGLRLL